MPRSPALIFDFGNVFAYFDYSVACEKLGRRFGREGPELLRALRASGLDALVREYESGRLAGEEFGRGVGRLAGFDFTHEEFVAAWADIFTLNEPVAALAAKLRDRGYTLVLGSNTNPIHAGWFRRRFAEALMPFHHLVLSYEVGAFKPEAEFYLACASAAGTAPGGCLFIDDMPQNVAGAEAAGMPAVRYNGVSALLGDLRARGIEVD